MLLHILHPYIQDNIQRHRCSISSWCILFTQCFNLLFDEALFSHKSLGHYYKAQQAVWLCSALWSNVAAVRKLMDFSLYCFTLANSNTCRKGRTSQLLIYQFTSTDEHLFDIILIIYHLYIMWNWTFEMCHLWQQHITQSLCSKPFNPVHQYVVAIWTYLGGFITVYNGGGSRIAAYAIRQKRLKVYINVLK